MAEAGFLHTPSDNSPDLAKCFFCLKELEGWEPEDDPLAEHKSHSPKCSFITLEKKVEELSVEEFLKLEMQRQTCILKTGTDQGIHNFEEGAVVSRAAIITSATSEQ
ncbi:hypothetical protein NHX12_034147 [Muraenolepis orangiensis]|uniref:Survivin n=1 Tax=Muraenolepis orangiensis TaxID=630683 RepID=A0A9Q0D8Q9_9TELE|nr:hypothetical protein NHX12_034147 [Muraenolepis orangiensis]